LYAAEPDERFLDRSVSGDLVMKLLLGFIAAGLMLLAPSAIGQDAAKGEKLFATKCKSCHGAQGQGNPAIAKGLGVTFRDLKSAEVQKQSDAEIKKLALGGHGKKKPVKSVTPAELDDIVAFVRTMK
jgi:mono/diheme cytochrome c family protein